MPASVTTTRRLEWLTHQRDAAHAELTEINDRATEADRELNESEKASAEQRRADIERWDAEIATEVDLARSTGSYQQLVADLGPAVRADEPRRAAVEAAAGEPVYRDFATYARDLLISRYDQIASRAGGPSVREGANERLQRVVANTLSSDVPGLIPPQHIAQIMQVINTNRPLVNASRRLGLTSGKITYPRITTRPTVSKQAAEKTETTSTKMTVEMVEKVAATFLGAGDLSWQAINWSTPDALTLWFDLAAEAYAQATEVETGAIFGTGFDPAGSPVAVAAPGGSAEWLGALAGAAGVVYANSKRVANGIATDPATFYALAPLASQARTVFTTEGTLNLSTQSGTVLGMNLFATPGLPAGTVLVGDFSALLTAETPGAPVELRAVEPSIGGMEVGVIGAFLVELIEEAAFCKVTPPPGAPPGTTTTSTTTSKK